MIEFSRLAAEDFDELNVVDNRNFGSAPIADQRELVSRVVEPDRFVVAKDQGRIVGGAGSYPMALTVPGGASLATSGVAWVSVSPTHTRQGITRTMMEMLRSQAVERNEPVLALTASEGGIYERFGYGVATFHRYISIDRTRSRLRPLAVADRNTGTRVRLVDPFDHVDEIIEIYGRYQRSRVGEVTRSADMFEYVYKPSGSELRVGALHPDGFAMWTIKPGWSDSHPRHKLELLDLFAVTDTARNALWQTILSVDLVDEIRSRVAVGPDDPLQLLLDNHRGVRTTGLRDHLWLRIEDAVTCFSARSYRTSDSFVIGVCEDEVLDHRVGPTFKRADFDEVFSVSDDGANRSRRRPNVAVTRACLGPLLLGSVSVPTLAAGRRLAAAPELHQRLEAFFGHAPIAHCQTHF